MRAGILELECQMLGIKRADLPQANSDAITENAMRKEREAKEFRAKGEMAVTITSTADKEVTLILLMLKSNLKL